MFFWNGSKSSTDGRQRPSPYPGRRGGRIQALTAISALVLSSFLFRAAALDADDTAPPPRPGEMDAPDGSEEALNSLPVKDLLLDPVKPRIFYDRGTPVFKEAVLKRFGFLKNCRLNKFALFASRPKILYFATYDFAPDSDGVGRDRGIAIFEETGFDEKRSMAILKPIIFQFSFFLPPLERLGFSEPRVIDTKRGSVLEIPCIDAIGSSVFYAHRYYLFENGEFVPLDCESWKKKVEASFPKGVGIWDWHPIDLAHLLYVSNLWGEDDPHSAPTAGKVIVHLKIENRSFAVDKIRFRLNKEPRSEDGRKRK